MKRQILLLAITAAALSSCSTAYKTGQTPDDVYFSPAKPQDEYVRVKEDKEEYRYDDDYYDDRYLRMKVQNRSRWDYLDDWYSYDRYGYRANYLYGTYYNPYTSWNYYYNPYCRNNVVVYYPKQTNVAYNVPKPRNFNLNSYVNTNYNNANSNIRMNGFKPTIANTNTRPVYNNRNSNNSFSNTVKQIFSGNNNNNSNNSSSTPTRTYTPSSSSSGSSSSGSSGSSSGSSRPTRGGN